MKSNSCNSRRNITSDSRFVMADPESRPPRSLRIAAVQMKFADSIPPNLDKIKEAVSYAAKRQADAILFPECATTGYACDFRTLRPAIIREALKELGRLATHFGINLLIGTPAFRGRQLQNCLVAFD